MERTQKTLTQIAKEHGYTKANASAVAKQYQHKHELRKTRGMKSDNAVEVYRERAIRVHKQRKTEEQKWKTQNKHHNSFSRLSTLRSALMQTLVRGS
jgi:hypothetical protein